MATSCKPMGELRFDDLFSGRLQKHGLYEHIIENKSTESRKSLTDGRNSIWVVGQPGGLVSELILKGTNDPKIIVEAILAEFQVKIVSEHELEFWGFESWEEWHRARRLQENEGFYEKLLEHFSVQCAGEVGTKGHMVPSGAASLDPIELLQIDIARKLISEDGTLLARAKKTELMVKIFEQIDQLREAFDRETDVAGQVALGDWCTSAEKDQKEGPLPPAGLIFEVNRQGVVVARERRGAREAEAERRRARIRAEDEIPF